MDPNATIELIVDAVRRGASEQLEEACTALASWIEADGFMPDTDAVLQAASRCYGNETLNV